MRVIGLISFLFLLGYCSITQSSTHQPKNSTNTIRSNIVRMSESMLGKQYKYGGKEPSGFDCSGLVYYVFGKNGYRMNASSSTQANQGSSLKKSQARPGDLVFLKRPNENNIFHVSIITKTDGHDLWVIHSTSSKGVIQQNITASNYWREKIFSFRNVID